MNPKNNLKIHTYSTGMVLTYDQFKKVWDACCKTGHVEDTSNIWTKRQKLYCYHYHGQGIKVYLTGKPGKLYRLRLQIEPCQVLGDDDPTALYHPTRSNYKQLVRTADKLLKKLSVPESIDDMKISRCDMTRNLDFEDQTILMEYLRILKKSAGIPHYEHVIFKKKDKKVKDHKTANQHSHCLSCKRASFLIYDKIAQLQMTERYDEALMDKHILRMEAELKRPALKHHLGKQEMVSNYKILSAAAEKGPKIINWYLERMQPHCKSYVRYENAVELVNNASFKEKTRKRMLYLLRKTSDRESLTDALEDMRRKFNLSKGQCSTILKKFEKLGISPITLRNDSEYEKLPFIRL